MEKYSLIINEINILEKEIKDNIKTLKEKQKDNTTRLEQATKKKLEEYSGKILILFEEIQNPKIKSSL